MVPDQAGALVVGVVVLGLAGCEARVEHLVDIARWTWTLGPYCAIRSRTRRGAAVADPRDETRRAGVYAGRVLGSWSPLREVALVSTGRMCFGGSLFVKVI